MLYRTAMRLFLFSLLILCPVIQTMDPQQDNHDMHFVDGRRSANYYKLCCLSVFIAVGIVANPNFAIEPDLASKIALSPRSIGLKIGGSDSIIGEFNSLKPDLIATSLGRPKKVKRD